MRNRTYWHMRQTKLQISLWIHANLFLCFRQNAVLCCHLMQLINVKTISFWKKEHTTDMKMGVSVLLRLFISSNEVCNIEYTLKLIHEQNWINPFMPSGLFYINSLDRSISYIRSLVDFHYHYAFLVIPVVNAYSVDPDQTPRSAASDLGLHCLYMSLWWDARLKWVIPLPDTSEGRFLWLRVSWISWICWIFKILPKV